MSLSFQHWQKFKNDSDFQRRFLLRSKFLDAVRSFFKEQQFLEVETPLMCRQIGLEPNLVPFETDLVFRGGKSERRYFIMSPEHQMKMLLCANMGNIFQICKCFRNCEEGGSLHNPEFSMLEWYRVNADYRDVMKDCENLFRFVAQNLFGRTSIIYRGETLELNAEWERMTVREAFQKFTDIENILTLDRGELFEKAKGLDLHVIDQDGWDDIFFKIFVSKIEPHLGRGIPTILCDYPAHMAALSKIQADSCERFEVYVAGMELANAFTELTDAREQRKRFEKENEERSMDGKATLPMPEDFLAAMEQGMPDCSGIALGLDRMFMLFADVNDIRDVLVFPEL